MRTEAACGSKAMLAKAAGSRLNYPAINAQSPSSNDQRNPKVQAPNSERSAAAPWGIRIWDLGFWGDFVPGNWNFPSAAMNARLLIIEDELPMRTALKDCLEAEGYRVLTAADGESGLKRVLEEKPDLILLDIMMPRLDGFAVCAELRRLSNPVPILMLTAKGEVEDRVTGLDAGADDYLVKPFSTEELLARVRAMLRRSHRQTKTPNTLALGDVR